MKSNGISECAAKRTQESRLEDNPAQGRGFTWNFLVLALIFSHHFLETFFPAIFSRLFEKANGILFMIGCSKYRVILLLEIFFFLRVLRIYNEWFLFLIKNC